MSTIFNKLKQHEKALEEILSSKAFLIPDKNTYTWTNKIFSNPYIRRAHLDCIDATTTKKLYMMHLCLFPQTNIGAPIYGFDIIAGPNKVTGAFLDFSPIDDSHQLCNWYSDTVKNYTWSKPRNLPDWAKKIFSTNMVAAGNINTLEELDTILNLSITLLEYYIENIPNSIIAGDYTSQQNFYCQQQKCNPHTPRVLSSLGFEQDMINDFIHNCLFPELV
jgi:hypothetical protein